MTSKDLLELGVVDEIVPEPEGGAHRDYDVAAANLGVTLRENLSRLRESPIDELLTARYQKFRALGNFAEGKNTGSSSRL